MVSLKDSQSVGKATDIVSKSTMTDGDVLLSVQGVSKKFCRDLKRSLIYGVQDIAAEMVGLRDSCDSLRKREFWALDNVSLELRRGTALGLVGSNGSGKSTLLRIIAGLIKPDAGTIEIKGKVAPLIALGAGFNPILTGRENIYANMSILGLSKAEIDERFDDVVEFAEIGDAIDSPVQSYSSGMAARLGFACAVHTEPDILLIDEVLAVGDMRFRVKCYRRLSELRKSGTSFIMVAHNPHVILSMCDQSAYLNRGKLLIVGDTPSVITKYEEDLFLGDSENKKIDEESSGSLTLPEKLEGTSYGLDIMSLHWENSQGQKLKSLKTANSAALCVKCRSDSNLDDIFLTVIVRQAFGEGESVLNLSSEKDDCKLNISAGISQVLLKMPSCSLKAGRYVMKVYLSQKGHRILDVVESFYFTVENIPGMSQCLFHQPHDWLIRAASHEDDSRSL